MEFVGLLVLIGLVVLVPVFYKARARSRFRKSVELYERTRDQRISQGESPGLIPTVEMFLAERGQLHLLAEIGRTPSDPSGQFEYALTMRTSVDLEEQDNDFDRRNDGYTAFVNEMWDKTGVDLSGYTLHRITGAGNMAYALHSLVAGDNGGLYLNGLENGSRKTYAADTRHKWLRSGEPIDHSAFIGISQGASPEMALGRQSHATSVVQALSAEYDRFDTKDNRYVIAHSSAKGPCYRVVSRVVRQNDSFSARCHFRWGDRRTFQNNCLLEVFDVQVGKAIEVPSFLAKRK